LSNIDRWIDRWFLFQTTRSIDNSYIHYQCEKIMKAEY
jgi:hypothetical protein